MEYNIKEKIREIESQLSKIRSISDLLAKKTDVDNSVVRLATKQELQVMAIGLNDRLLTLQTILLDIQKKVTPSA